MHLRALTFLALASSVALAPACTAGGDDGSLSAAAERQASLTALADQVTTANAVAHDAEALARPLSSGSELAALRRVAAARALALADAYESAVLAEGTRVRRLFAGSYNRWMLTEVEASLREYVHHVAHGGSTKATAQLDDLLAFARSQASVDSSVWQGSPVGRVLLEAEAVRRVARTFPELSSGGLSLDENVARARRMVAAAVMDPQQEQAVLKAIEETKGDPGAFVGRAKLVQGLTDVALAAGLFLAVVEAGPEAVKGLREGKWQPALRAIGTPLLTLAVFSSAGQALSAAAVKTGIPALGEVIPFVGLVAVFGQAYAFAHQDHDGPAWTTAVQTLGIATQTVGALIGLTELVAVGAVTPGVNLVIAVGGLIYAGGVALESEAARRARLEETASIFVEAGYAPAAARALAESARVERPASLVACFGWSPDYVRREAEAISFVFSSSDSMAGICRFAQDFGLVSGPVGAARDTGIGEVLHDPKLGKVLWEQANAMSPSVQGRDGWCHAFSTKVLGIGAPLNRKAQDRFCGGS